MCCSPKTLGHGISGMCFKVPLLWHSKETARISKLPKSPSPSSQLGRRHNITLVPREGFWVTRKHYNRFAPSRHRVNIRVYKASGSVGTCCPRGRNKEHERAKYTYLVTECWRNGWIGHCKTAEGGWQNFAGHSLQQTQSPWNNGCAEEPPKTLWRLLNRPHIGC